MTTQPEFLIDTILPANEVHLLAGPTGAGKTRWLLKTLKDKWERGKPVLGYKSHPVQWCYVAADRSMESVNRTFTAIGLNPKEINIIPAWGKNKLTLPQILDRIEASKARMAVIEAFQSFSDSMDKQSVKGFLNSVQTQADKGLTIIGVCESPKMKPYEKYENPRQRVSGVASWGHFSDTIMLVEPHNNPETRADSGRILHVCPRNGPMKVYLGGFSSDGTISFYQDTDELEDDEIQYQME